MKNITQPDIIVSVRLFSTTEGGRASPTPPKVFRCVFEFEGEAFDCALLLDGVGALSPGSEAEVPVAFIFPQYIKERLRPGSHFSLWEGKYIAVGEVIKIVE